MLDIGLNLLFTSNMPSDVKMKTSLIERSRSVDSVMLRFVSCNPT